MEVSQVALNLVDLFDFLFNRSDIDKFLLASLSLHLSFDDPHLWLLLHFLLFRLQRRLIFRHDSCL